MNEKRKVIVFGDGALGVATGGEEGHSTNELIVFKLKKPVLPIGRFIENTIEKTTDELDTISRWRFKNPVSAQVVIDALEIIKKAIKEDSQ